MQHSQPRIAAFPTITVVWIALLAVGGCRDSRPATAPELQASHGHSQALHSAPVTGAIQRDVARLRELTAGFNRFDAAFDAGWNARITECFANPELGAMGFHYGNPALIDGRVDVLEPELLLYEPQKNGRLRLVAVEYIVPFTAWTGAEPPELYGQSFHRNEAFGIWALHVWHMRENPRGIFADWNPKVSCRYAE
jgi:hypothetical protein